MEYEDLNTTMIGVSTSGGVDPYHNEIPAYRVVNNDNGYMSFIQNGSEKIKNYIYAGKIDNYVFIDPYNYYYSEAFNSHQLLKRFEAADMAPTFRRLPDGQRLTTDAGNYIIDLHLEVIEHPQALAYYLEQTIGVVEHGLFLNVADAVIIGGEKLVIIERENVENH